MGTRMNRRNFLKTSAVSGGAVLVIGSAGAASSGSATSRPAPQPALVTNAPRLPDLTLARWIWYPSERTLQNTFILFRRELTLRGKPRRATGWIAADSRYLL